MTAVDNLLKQADLAMYRAKASGRNVVSFFDPAMEASVRVRAELEEDLRRAISGNQFLLHYQPQVVGEGRITGAEALLRWQHPHRGAVFPAHFIPLAEETNLILPLGRWVLETACAQLAAWSAHPELSELTIAVNVSANQFRQRDFVNQVLEIVEKSGANPRRLKLELTESLLVHNVDDVIEKMYALKVKGIGFSLDDFGTGYSSLSYLKRLPLDQLKIDQSFVRDILIDPNDAAIAKTIVALAQSLGLAVIAEGVETKEQRDFLAQAGCHAYQGYFYGRPVPIDQLEASVQA
jgi:EAL domain-containing protein (putative c-di-GMP-specific phosphodiesterase class I)